MRTFGTITLKESEWEIRCEPQVALRLKRMFPSVRRAYKGYLTLSNIPSNCRDILWFIRRYPLIIKDIETMRKSAEDHEKMLTKLDKIARPNYVPRSVPLAIPLWDFQRRAVEIMLNKKSLLLADDVGLGKTASSIGVFINQKARPVLVVTLTHLPIQWKHEINDFAPELKVFIPKKGRPEPGSNPLEDKPDVIILNYHKLSGWAEHLVGYIKTVVWDESQELRRSESQKYDAAMIIASACEYRMGLTATPVYNLGGEIYNVMEAIDPGALGSKQEFIAEWGGYSDSRGRIKIEDPIALGSYLKENHLMLMRSREEVGREIPKITSIHHVIEHDGEALNEIKSEAVDLAKILVGETKVTRTERFHAGGQFDMLMRQATGIAKAPYVADFAKILVETGEKIVLFGWHREVYSIWLEKLKGYRPAMYTGKESPIQKIASFERFRDGDTNILIMSLRSGAGLDGLQYTGCRTVLFGELDWSPGIHHQCIGRIHREGQSEPVMAYYLVTEDGADPFIIDALGIKRAQAEGIRNPDKQIVEKVIGNPKKQLKELAESYLNSIREQS